jgi:acid phosphatase
VPWASFPDLCREATPQDCANLRFSDFPSDFRKLPTVSIVVPDLLDDMHGVSRAATSADVDAQVRLGDTWVRRKLGPYYQWARSHNSLLIVTFDENENSSRYAGLTDPASSDPVIQNRIATVFAGARIRPGTYEEGRGITHVNILRTIEAMYGLDRSGAQQPRAQAAGIGEDPVTDVFTGR